MERVKAGRVTLGVLISGRGSNLQSIIDACRDENFPAKIGIVLSNRADAYGLVRAQEAGLETAVIDHKNFTTREEFETEIHAVLIAHGVDLVCLAGFMRVLTAGFVKRWENRMINIHPSLLPKFKGLHTHQRALDAGETSSGCTVHYVTAEMDEGPVIVQREVSVTDDDTVQSLAAKILAEEHIAYPQAIRMVSEEILKS